MVARNVSKEPTQMRKTAGVSMMPIPTRLRTPGQSHRGLEKKVWNAWNRVFKAAAAEEQVRSWQACSYFNMVHLKFSS